MKKLVLSLILATLCGISAFAYDFSAVSNGKTLYYKITSSSSPYTVEVTYETYPTGEYLETLSSSSYSSLSGSLVIPSSVTYDNRTYSVTSIGDMAFCVCRGLTSVTIPNSVTSIGYGAFVSCSGLSSITIPNYVTSIGDYTFYGCSGLTMITIPNSVTSIGDGAFMNCSGLSSITIPNYVTSIGDYTFYGCSGLTMITIPNSVTSIGSHAFYGCNELTSVSIGNSVTSIGAGAFYNCSGLTTVNFNATNCELMGHTYSFYDDESNYHCDNDHYVFYGCSALSTLNIGNNVTYIPDYAFPRCSGLSSVTIPNSVTNIGKYAFKNCSGLTSVTIGNSVTSIGEDAFCNCSGLTIVNFNATNCTTMGRSSGPVFSLCTSLATLNIGSNVTNIPDYAFKNCSGLTSVTIPNSVTDISSSAFYGCSGLISVTIPNSVTDISSYAFYGCSGLISVTIPNSVTYIGNYAFNGCSGLTAVNYTGNIAQWSEISFGNEKANPLYCAHNLYVNNELVTDLVIPQNVTTIKQYTFYGAICLTSASIGDSVASIGSSAFYGCSGLTSVLFNATNCTTMGSSSSPVFSECSALEILTIGENVATIPNNAFKNCTSLDSIISYASNPPVIYGGTFDSELSLNTPVVVPCGTVEAYEDADFWYNFRHIQQRADCGATCTITVMSNNSAWGTVSGGGTYMAGETATLTATPNSGYSFSNWSDGSTENPHDVVVTADATYIATFVQGGSSNPTVYNSIEATACGSYTWNDRTYTESGEYQQTFTAANSADSIVTLTLTIHPAPQPQITLYGELDACNPSSVAFATDQYQSYLWSNGATTMITSTSVPGFYYVEVTDENGCTGMSEQVNIGASNALTEAPQISVVGMNSENRNVVAWSALDNANVNAYRIYRENNVADVYEPMAVVGASETSWTDETADPTARAYRYKVTAVDECGGESPMSDYHKTMHLTINQGIGNTWNLIWSHYEGFNFGTYRIYRGTNPSNMTMIGEVPSNLNSYTDNTATDNTGFYYQVEVVRNSRSRDAEISSRSNIVDNGIFPEYTITVMSANPNRGTVTGGGTYPEGTVITIEAIANEGFEFASWSDENTDNPRQITVTADATYIATFDEVSSVTEYTITVMSANPNRGTVTGGGTYPEGTVITIEAIANEGFEFASWSDENTDNPRQITVTADATYIATFDEVSSVTEYTITVMSANPNRGTVTGGGTYPEGTVITIEAIANEGFVFASWSDGNTDNPRQITVTADATYIASFDEVSTVTEYTITVISANPNRGTVTGGGTYPEGTVVTIEAIANDGYEFSMWDDESAENPRQITVTANATYVASFDPATNIDENVALEINVFPNPATDILNITSSETISEIEIVNTLGQVVKRIEVNSDNAVCDVEDLKAGVYVVRIRTLRQAQGAALRKFVKE